MQSKPKTNSIVTSAYDAERNVLTFTVLECGEVELDLNKVHEANIKHAAVHGFNQRIPDAAAIGVTDAEGNVIPRAERNRIKYERMNELCAFYESGTAEWSRRGEGGGGGGRSVAVEAFARDLDIPYAEAKERAERVGKSKGRTWNQQLAVLRKLYAAQIAIIEEERARGLETLDHEAEIEELRSA